MISGELRITLSDGAGDDTVVSAQPGDAVVVPGGTTLRVDNPDTEPATAWVTTRAGLEATLADGTTISPPWAR